MPFMTLPSGCCSGDQDSGDIFPIFYHLILASVQIIIWLARVTFCCRNPSASMVSVLGIWSCSSAYPSYYNQGMQLLLQCGLSFLTSSINNTENSLDIFFL